MRPQNKPLFGVIWTEILRKLTRRELMGSSSSFQMPIEVSRPPFSRYSMHPGNLAGFTS